MKLSIYRLKQKEKCRRLIRFASDNKSKNIGRPQKKEKPMVTK